MRSFALTLLIAGVAFAQQSTSFDAQAYATQQFGSAFQVVANVAPMRGDLDGDGVEDLVIVANNKNPMSDVAGSTYKVVDPYNAYFGFGDPRVTLQFGAKDPGGSRHLLIVHSWQLPQPKAKFVVVNVPFEKIELSHFTYKKKTRDSVLAHEVGGLTSVVFWDGKKKYRWEPLMHDE